MTVRINHQGLNAAVQDYFNHNCHPEYKKMFELERIEVSDKNHNILHAVPRGLEEEDLQEHHYPWERGLQDAMAHYGLQVQLPYWAFEK